MLPISIKEISCVVIFKTIHIDLNKSGTPIEYEKFIVLGHFAITAINHRLDKDATGNFTIAPFPIDVPVVMTKVDVHCFTYIVAIDVFGRTNKNIVPAAMAGLNHIGRRKRTKRDILGPVPHPKGRNNVLRANKLRNLVFYRNLVGKNGKTGIALVKFSPMNFFIIRARMIDVGPFMK